MSAFLNSNHLQAKSYSVTPSVKTLQPTLHDIPYLESDFLNCFNVVSSDSTCDDKSDMEELGELYETLHQEWIKTAKNLEASNKEKNVLKTTVSKLRAELSMLQKKLTDSHTENDHLKESATRIEAAFTIKDIELEKVQKKLDDALCSIEKFNKGKGKLDEVTSIGQADTSGLGFKVYSKKVPNCPTFLKECETNSYVLKNQYQKTRRTKYMCHYCFTPGHIHPFCRKLFKNPV